MEVITQSGEPPKPAERALRKLAAALSCQVDCFGAQAPSDLHQTAEMLRLWGDIHRAEDRAKVLAFIAGMGDVG